jgi:hypothetical protein
MIRGKISESEAVKIKSHLGGGIKIPGATVWEVTPPTKKAEPLPTEGMWHPKVVSPEREDASNSHPGFWYPGIDLPF